MPAGANDGAVRFVVLGPVQALRDGTPLPIRGNERRILGLLLARSGQVVSADSLIDALWGDDVPRTAEKTLQAYVARLRRTLEPQRGAGEAPQLLVTEADGYAIRADPDDVDAQRFAALVARGHEQLDAAAVTLAVATLREALALWQGPPYQGLTALPGIEAECARLEELRLAALEDRLDAELRLGQAAPAVAELESLVRAHPFRERLWALLMTALYRSGRQADALAAFQAARQKLDDELGIAPGAELQRVQAAVLANDPELDVIVGPTPVPFPAELDSITPLAGRDRELRWLGRTWQRAAVGGGVALVQGARGIGKTRVVAELARNVHVDGAVVLYAGCRDERSDPIAPLSHAVAPTGVDLDALLANEADAAPALLTRLTTTAPGQPVLLVVDDVDRAERELVTLLRAIAGAVADYAGVLVVLTYDPDAARRDLWSLVDAVDPARKLRLMLGPLADRQLRAIVELYVGARDVATATAAVARDSGGVPAQVHAMASAFARSRAVDRIRDASVEAEESRARLDATQAELTETIGELQGIEHRSRAGAIGVATRRPRSPYKGLASYDESDRDVFFGRERLVAEVAALLATAPLVAVVGASGSGKSSLLRAGLLPALVEGVLPDLADHRHVVVRPGERPMRELAAALGLEHDAPAADVARAVDDTTLLVVDQFEELFSVARGDERDGFVEVVSRVARAASGARLLLALRSDFYPALAAYPPLAALVARHQVIVAPMQPDELRRAIVLPARSVGVSVDEALADALVTAVVGQPGTLPILASCLVELWERRRGSALRSDDLAAIGGVHGSVARLAERVLARLPANDQAIARDILLRLVGPADADVASRRRAALSEFDVDRDPATARVLEHLVESRLLTSDGERVELAHEALIREWPRLRHWVDEVAEARRVHDRLRDAARSWADSGRDPAELYGGARLAAVLEWIDAGPSPAPNELERSFVDASRDRAEHERLVRRRRVRVGMFALTAVVAALAVLAGVALVARTRANDERRLAASREVAAEAVNQLDIDPQLSLLLSLEAYRLAPTDEAVAALRRGVVTSHLRKVLPVRAGLAFAHAVFSPDGRTVVTGGHDGAVVW
ncbi:MAG: AAA family ATPase, partial [Frankia sp.]|nr:AAA family ATPase [Frankia sp.]